MTRPPSHPLTEESAMTTTIHRTLLSTLALAVIAAAGVPRTAQAQPAARPPADPAPEPQTAQDRDVLAAADQLASEAAQLIEQWITTQAITEDRLFARLYFPVGRATPQKFASPYDTLAERDLVGPEDKALTHATTLQYAIVTDSNGYVPAHNTKFTQPLTGSAAQDYINNRTKRILGDPASLVAARSEARYLIQRTRIETGDVIYDLSVPITVRGRHWGCARIGYRRTE
jgi:methyl-accepting chemotaxis protein